VWYVGFPWVLSMTEKAQLELSVGVTGHAEILEIDGLFTQGSRPGRTCGESVGGILVMSSSHSSNGI